jgi:hypothetical protein
LTFRQRISFTNHTNDTNTQESDGEHLAVLGISTISVATDDDRQPSLGSDDRPVQKGFEIQSIRGPRCPVGQAFQPDVVGETDAEASASQAGKPDLRPTPDR